MAVQSFEVVDIKCIDRGDGDQGVIFIGKDKLVTLVMDRDRQGHDKEICELQRTLWSYGRRPFTMSIQDL
jgi:hypothetical protein